MPTLTISTSFSRPPEPMVFKNPNYRISTQNLKTLDDLLKLTAACALYYWINPIQTVNGALSGAAIRCILGEPATQQDERTERASRTASICFSAMSTAFAFATPGPQLCIPFVLGLSAAADGAFGLMRRYAGSSKNNV